MGYRRSSPASATKAMPLLGAVTSLAVGIGAGSWAAGVSAGVPKVVISDCRAIAAYPGRVECSLLPTDSLALFVEGQPCEAVQLSMDGQSVQPQKSRPVDGGCQFQLQQPVPSGSAVKTLMVQSKGSGLPWKSIFLEVGSDPLERTNAILSRVPQDLRETPVELRSKCQRLGTIEDKLDCYYASALEKASRADPPEDDYARAMDIADRAGLRARSFKLRVRLALSLLDRGELAEAEHLLYQAYQYIIPEHAPDLIFWNAHMGYLARAQEDLEKTVTALAKARTLAVRIGDCEQLRRFSSIGADALLSLGRAAEVDEWMTPVRQCSEVLSGCDRVHYYGNLGWLWLRLEDESKLSGTLIRITQESAKDLFDRADPYQSDCHDSQRIGFILAGRAEMALRAGDFPQAQELIERARNEKGLFPGNRLELFHREGQVLLGMRRPKEAAQSFAKLEQALSTNEYRGYQGQLGCLAEIGKIEALAMQGQAPSALSEQARACLDKSKQPDLSASEVKLLKLRVRAMGYTP